MRNTGMTRPVDVLGRVVIPKEIRDSLNIKMNDRLLVLLDGEDIILRKIGDRCFICSSENDLLDVKDKMICKNCKRELVGK